MSGEWSQLDKKALNIEEYILMFANMIHGEIINKHLPNDLSYMDDKQITKLKESIFNEKADDSEKELVVLLEELYFICKDYNWYRSGDSDFNKFHKTFNNFKKRYKIPTKMSIAKKTK